MFGLGELKQTRVYQEALEEGIEIGKRKARLEIIPHLIAFNFTTEQIAQVFNLSLEEVTQLIQELP